MTRHRINHRLGRWTLGFATAALVFALDVPLHDTSAHAQQSAQKEEDREVKTKKTPALREKVYEILTEAQTFGENDQFEEALSTLRRLEKFKDLNSYEAANMHSFYAFIYYQQENYRGAIQAYEKVLAQPDLPETMRTQSIYALGQLYFTVENYPKAIEMLEIWFRDANNPGPEPYIFLSQAYYQQKRYREAVGPLDTGIRIARERNRPIKENWLLLKRVYHYELKEYDKVAQVLNQLIALYPKRDYWTQLSAVYGELGQTDRQLAVLELAYMQNYLDRSQDLRNLAQLFMLNGVPLRGGQVLEKAMNENLVDSDFSNLRLLSQAWSTAREDDSALPVLQRAARQAPDGKLDLRVAYTLMNQDQFVEAADAAREALRKGGLRNPDEARLLIGTALFNADRLSEARAAFEQADGSRARQWLSHISKEEQRREMLREVKRQGDAAAERAKQQREEIESI